MLVKNGAHHLWVRPGFSENERMEEKRLLRQEMKRRFAAADGAVLERQSALLREKREAHPWVREARVVAAYCALPPEPDLGPLLERWAGEKTVLLPVTTAEGIRLRRYGGAGRMRKGRYGILEPDGEEWWEEPGGVDLVIVPGVAFDRAGNRLGHGKAYYDRFLRPLAVRRVGVCFPFQLVDEVPHDDLDCRMDAVLSC